MSAPGLTASGRCKMCGKLQARLCTDGMGHVLDVPAPCGCVVEASKPKPPKLKRTPAWRKNVDDARRLACVCQLCDEPVAGKPKVSLYCQIHRTEREKLAAKRWRAKTGAESERNYRTRHAEKLRKKARAYYQTDPAVRERRNLYKVQWRKLNRDKVRAQKERAALKSFRDPQPGVKRWRLEVEAGERKPRRARRNQHGNRLCCLGLCRQVVTGHARMCERCKAVEARRALQALPTILRRAA